MGYQFKDKTWVETKDDGSDGQVLEHHPVSFFAETTAVQRYETNRSDSELQHGSNHPGRFGFGLEPNPINEDARKRRYINALVKLDRKDRVGFIGPDGPDVWDGQVEVSFSPDHTEGARHGVVDYHRGRLIFIVYLAEERFDWLWNTLGERPGAAVRMEIGFEAFQEAREYDRYDGSGFQTFYFHFASHREPERATHHIIGATLTVFDPLPEPPLVPEDPKVPLYHGPVQAPAPVTLPKDIKTYLNWIVGLLVVVAAMLVFNR